ncbi:AraC family transcriptional regulator [Shewanella vesiculosa]|uniref:AraC family transcriptional regulator n=1 Tax=Shewanella vesiculosa TaxID=518738 RepID=UPI00384EA0D0
MLLSRIINPLGDDGTDYVNSVPRPVVAMSAYSVTHDWEHAQHKHHKAQLFLTIRGIIKCDVEGGVWIVPPQCALWVPGDLLHSARGTGETECYCLFVEPDTVPNLPNNCCTLSVSPLMRELLIKASSLPALYPLDGSEERLIATLLDELTAAPTEYLHLPMPIDARLIRLVNMLLDNPADKFSVGHWASVIGMSERSLTRLLSKEIGMSFGQWRRQMHIIISLQRLSKGESVQTVALDLGYENASGFVTMFRKVLGKPPARYLAEHKIRISKSEQNSHYGILFPNEN